MRLEQRRSVERVDHASAVQAGTSSTTRDARLTPLSCLVAVLLSCAALDLIGLASLARQGCSRAAWLFFGAVVLGIWSMHFTVMPAFDTGVPVSYDVSFVVVPALVAVAASIVVLRLPSPLKDRAALGGCTAPGLTPASTRPATP